MSATTGRYAFPPAGRYGVVAAGVSGAETIYCRTDGAARRVRRALRYHRDSGGWTGAVTLVAVADLAAIMPGKSSRAIVAEFCRRGAAAEGGGK